MSVLVGLNNIKSCYIGTKPVKAIYVGTTKVWPTIVIPSTLEFIFTDGSLSLYDDFYGTTVSIVDYSNSNNTLSLDADNTYGTLPNGASALNIKFTITKSSRFNQTHKFTILVGGYDAGYVVINRNTTSGSVTINVPQTTLKEIATDGEYLTIEIVPTEEY